MTEPDEAHESSGGKYCPLYCYCPPVGCTLGEGELVHIVAVQLTGQHFRGGVNFAGAFYKVAASAIKFDLFDFAFRVQEGITAINGRPSRRAK